MKHNNCMVEKQKLSPRQRWIAKHKNQRFQKLLEHKKQGNRRLIRYKVRWVKKGSRRCYSNQFKKNKI